MSLFNIHLNTNLEEDYPPYLSYNEELKKIYGEVNTPYWFIKKMFEIIPSYEFLNKDLKWLDAGAGRGNYSIYLFFILFKKLENIISDEIERKRHIINNMIYMVEYNSENTIELQKIFGENANIINNDYISWDTEIEFDYIIGNPPYNSNGIKKVPTKNNVNKKNDGKTIWHDFIKKNISLLKTNGKMNVLIPSIWMKPDKAKMYNFLLDFKIEKLHALNSSQVNKIFNYHVQTPICYFLLTKTPSINKITLYDELKDDYQEFPLYSNIPIPLCFSSIVYKFLKITNNYTSLKVLKTNPIPSNIELNDSLSSKFLYKNIKTTILNKNKEPELQIVYSNKSLPYHNKSKIVMAHKMYGFPYIDEEGIYGICTRDNYVIINKSFYEMELIKEFLSTNLILFLFETTRYRMRYLEKYVFEYIPDFSQIPEAIKIFHNYKNNVEHEKNIFEKNIFKLFDINEIEQKFIERYFNIKYKFFT